ncbi:MAG: nuclease-related domain-containing protein [Actinomycetes bacterium]
MQRRAELFEQGAEGEAATARVLATLPPGWTAIHEVRWPSRRLANIDHVLVGPGGIFVIDSKNWSGRVSVDNGQLRQNGRSREKAVAGTPDPCRVRSQSAAAEKGAPSAAC